MSHTFHIPVLGLAYSIDSPIKVAPLAISSTISIVDDIAIERIRTYYHQKYNFPFTPISNKEDDARAKRITAYLNLVQILVDLEFEEIKAQDFGSDNQLTTYFSLLPASSLLKKDYQEMLAENNGPQKLLLQKQLKKNMVKGAIDVNIMSKVDKMNVDANGELKTEIFSDALAALRGFANSNLNSSVVLSAGMNPRLYSYLETFTDFLPNKTGQLNKKVILKVSDFRSAFIQAKFLAKKSIWISEFRIESGLNCGGHAFATEGYLLGPILEEFKQNKTDMLNELFTMYQNALTLKGIEITNTPQQKITVQGGIGTAEEDQFLTQHYQLDGTGWGSPFLLVPQVTAVDDQTMEEMATATARDYHISTASPLGIPFNNFTKSSSERQRQQRIAAGKPGNPCTKKFLVSNTEFTTKPICTASSKYQNLKIKQLQNLNLSAKDFKKQSEQITSKICLCEGLVNSFYIKNEILNPKENTAVAICPGPNLAFFNKIYSLSEMVNHIYGNQNLLKGINRPHIFINELKLYINYLQTDIKNSINQIDKKKEKYLNNFSNQLQVGINYYKNLFNNSQIVPAEALKNINKDLINLENKLINIFQKKLNTV